MMKETWDLLSSLFWFIVAVLSILTGCAAMQAIGGFFTGAAKGAGDALPDAIDDLSSGRWMNALITLGAGAVAGGVGWFEVRRRKRKRAAENHVPNVSPPTA